MGHAKGEQFKSPTPILMKALLNLCSAVGFVCVVSLAARNSETSTSPGVSGRAAVSVTRPASAPAAAFNSHARSKVVQYFDTFRSDPQGLPPGLAGKIRTNEIPTSWETSRIAPGVVIRETERSFLVDVPQEWVRVFSAHPHDFRYCLAGSNLVAVDKGYKIVDSIRIPTIRLSEVEEEPAEEAGEVQLVRHRYGRYR